MGEDRRIADAAALADTMLALSDAVKGDQPSLHRQGRLGRPGRRPWTTAARLRATACAP
jgi:hypothetical protein